MNKNSLITWLMICCVILAACDSTYGNNSQQATDPPNPNGPDPITSETTPKNDPDSNEANPKSEPTQDRTERLTITVMPEKVNPADLTGNNPIIGEVPDEILEKIIDDLVERISVAQQNIQIIRSEAVTWSDGSLGCPKPGELYTQGLVDGYWVVLMVDGVEYDYRVSHAGYFTLCEGGGTLPISPPER